LDAAEFEQNGNFISSRFYIGCNDHLFYDERYQEKKNPSGFNAGRFI
jgi:hypothetical protein